MAEDSVPETVEAVEDLGRRRFLGYVSGVLSAIIAVALGVPLLGMFLSPAFAKRKALWVKLGPERSVGQRPTKFTYSYVRRDGWLEKTVHRTAYGVTLRSGKLIVLSNICTHLGCGVRWDDEAKAFLCPCHNGVYNIDGTVRSGPPPRPLDRYEYRVVKGTLDIRVKEA